LREHRQALSPDFNQYADMPTAIQILMRIATDGAPHTGNSRDWSAYRRFLGAMATLWHTQEKEKRTNI
jgi:hypothetical protein